MEGQVFKNNQGLDFVIIRKVENKRYLVRFTFSNTHELNRQMIHRCLSGECRQHKGWRFSYVNSI